jgi:ABC-type uncharacterized transport system permease subunit
MSEIIESLPLKTGEKKKLEAFVALSIPLHAVATDGSNTAMLQLQHKTQILRFWQEQDLILFFTCGFSITLSLMLMQNSALTSCPHTDCSDCMHLLCSRYQA